MTSVVVDPSPTPSPDEGRPPAPAVRRAPTVAPTEGPPRRRVGVLVVVWSVVVLGSLALTVYLLEPLFQANDQSDLLESYRADITRAANEARGLPGVSVPTKAPELGSPVAILEVGDLQLQQVVVEGASSSQTQVGPGHVPGTAAPGQPGNAVVVGRRFSFGAPFSRLRDLEPGAAILVTTTQGQVVYTVESVEQLTLVTGDPEISESSSLSSDTTGARVVADETSVQVDELYGPTEDDRLTLVTSASASPWNASEATVVIARMEGIPYEPTPQGGRTDSQTGLSGESAAWAPLLLALLGFAASGAAAAYLYRNASARSAYLLTTPPLIVFTILTAEQITRLFPSWM